MLPLKYRADPSLDFLQFCSHGDLEPLVEILTLAEGKPRWPQYLLGDDRFRPHAQDLPKAWELVAAAIQRYGADDVASLIRLGEGVLYREVIGDVCVQMKVPLTGADTDVEHGADTDVEQIERRLLAKVLENAWEKMSDEERVDFARNLKDRQGDATFDPVKIAPAALLAALQGAILAGGFASYQMAMVAANFVSRAILNRGLALAGNAALARGLAVFAGPVGWALTVILAVPLLTGPALRITIPATLYVAYLRQKNLNQDLLQPCL
ncbi:MAG: DUF3944 domain-containing protein [Prosthecobacter sp.]|uniref:DUF3944 domain-containing protein n=1 Tax=Prosthecobacter sp. TaxID=1965333 RepID=UPI003BB05695